MIGLSSTTLGFASSSSLSLITHPPIDWVIMFVVALIFLVDTLRSGSARTATLAIAFPLAYFFSEMLPHAAVIGPLASRLTTPIAQAAVFGVLFGVLAFLVYRILYALGGSAETPTQAVAASISATIVALVIWLQVPALQFVWHFSPLIESIFGAAYAFWWLAASFILMAFVRS